MKTPVKTYEVEQNEAAKFIRAIVRERKAAHESDDLANFRGTMAIVIIQALGREALAKLVPAKMRAHRLYQSRACFVDAANLYANEVAAFVTCKIEAAEAGQGWGSYEWECYHAKLIREFKSLAA